VFCGAVLKANRMLPILAGPSSAPVPPLACPTTASSSPSRTIGRPSTRLITASARRAAVML